MSKETREQVALSATDETIVVAKKAPKAKKEVVDEVLYMTDKFAEPVSVFGAIRQYVYDRGGSALRSEITSHMIENFKPKKSTMPIEAYIRSYMRDVTKLGFLTAHEDKKFEGGLGERKVYVRQPENGERPPKAKKDESGLSELGRKILETLGSELTSGEVAEGTSTVTVEGLATIMKKNAQNLRMSLKSLVSREYISIVKGEEQDTIILTQKGWDEAHKPAAEEASSED